MLRRSRLDCRFDRECAWAAPPSCLLNLLVSGRIQPALDIRLQEWPRAKKLTVLHSIFSYLLVLFYASVRWILFRIAGEALRFSAEILRRRLRTNKQNLEATAEKPINRCNKKVTELLLSTVEPEVSSGRITGEAAVSDVASVSRDPWASE